jgi:hypothetical protein
MYMVPYVICSVIYVHIMFYYIAMCTWYEFAYASICMCVYAHVHLHVHA